MSVRLAVVFLLLFCPPMVLAEQKPWSLRKQVLLSQTIARGKVVSITDQVVAVTRTRLIKAYQAKVSVAEVVKGSLKDTSVLIHYRRHIGKTTPFPEVTIRPGKEYVFYLVSGERNRLEMVSPYFGAVRNYYGLMDDIRGVLAKRGKPHTRTKPLATPRTKPKPAAQPRPAPTIKIPKMTAPKPVKGMQAIARIEKDSLKGGQPIKLWLVLKNIGQKRQDLYFHTLDRFCTFEIFRIDPSATKLRAEDPKSPEPPRASAYVPLEKDSYIYTSIQLDRYIQFKAGTYQARVRVEIPALYAGQALGKSGWTGRVYSSWVRFQVTGKPPTQQKTWRRQGVCNDTHLGVLDHGRCKRCNSRTSSKTKELCVFCADELGICPFCCRKSED